MANNKDELVEMFLDNTGGFLSLVSREFPLTLDLLNKYGDKLDWDQLSANRSLLWTEEILTSFEDKWNWESIARFSNFPCSIELLKRYEQKIDFRLLSQNQHIPWSIPLIEAFQEKWDWVQLCMNNGLPWSIELIEKFENSWDWEYMLTNVRLESEKLVPILKRFDNKINWAGLSDQWSHVDWSAELIEAFENKWKWKKLSANTHLPWTGQFIERYADKWKWNRLQKNEGILWSAELVRKYMDRLDFEAFENRSMFQYIRFDEELIKLFKDKISWKNLSRNRCLSVDIIRKHHEELLEDGWITDNYSVPWSADLIDEFKDKWAWNGLANNKSLPWSKELLYRFEDLWDYRYLSQNKKAFFTEEIIERHEDEWNWDALCGNPSLPWSPGFYKKYRDRFQKNSASVFSHFFAEIDEEIIHKVLGSEEKEQAAEVSFHNQVTKDFSLWEDSGYRLNIISGKIIACEPFRLHTKLRPFAKEVPPGKYPVKYYKSGGRVALAMVVLLSEKIKTIEHWILAKYTDGSASYDVDMATGCFADYEANVIMSKTDNYDKLESAFEMPFNQTKIGDRGANIIGFSTGMGDGVYSSYWGLDKDNEAVCLVTDFGMIK